MRCPGLFSASRLECVGVEEGQGLLSREDVVEIVALRRRGWSVSAIARHTGRDRKTIRVWLEQGGQRRRLRAASVLEPFPGLCRAPLRR